MVFFEKKNFDRKTLEKIFRKWGKKWQKNRNFSLFFIFLSFLSIFEQFWDFAALFGPGTLIFAKSRKPDFFVGNVNFL